MRRRRDLKSCPSKRFRGDGAFREADAAHSGDPRYRTQKRHKRRKIVRPDIEQRPRTRPIEKRRVRMPRLHAATEHRRVKRDGLTDSTFIDRLAARLHRRAQKGRGSAGDAQASLLGQLEQRARVRQRRCQGFFVVDVFARLERGSRHRRVRLRHGQVDDNLYFWTRQQFGDRERLEAEFGGSSLRQVHVQVATRGELEVWKMLHRAQVERADTATTDDTDHLNLRSSGS